LTEPKDTSSSPAGAAVEQAAEADTVPAVSTDPAADPPAPGDPAPRGVRSLRLRKRSRADAAEADPQETGVIERPPDPDQATGAIQMPAPRGGARLRRERRELMAKREEMLFHLGGLTFELYRVGRLGEAVARHRAGMVAEIDEVVRDIDARLEEIAEAKGRRRAPGPALPADVGACLVCRAPFFADARFCMSCGARFAPPPPELLSPGAGDTQVIPVPPAAEGTT